MFLYGLGIDTAKFHSTGHRVWSVTGSAEQDLRIRYFSWKKGVFCSASQV